MRGLIAPLENVLNEARAGFAEYVYQERLKGASWQALATRTGIHRSTARLYAQRYERVGQRYGYVEDQAPTCNAIRLRCAVCPETFTASRGDARYCSNACRQDAYRKRKVGAAA